MANIFLLKYRDNLSSNFYQFKIKQEENFTNIHFSLFMRIIRMGIDGLSNFKRKPTVKKK